MSAPREVHANVSQGEVGRFYAASAGSTVSLNPIALRIDRIVSNPEISPEQA